MLVAQLYCAFINEGDQTKAHKKGFRKKKHTGR